MCIKSKKVAIFGGTFDPPTYGHLSVCNTIINTHIVDEIWVCPSFNPLKDNVDTSWDDRYFMCQLAFSGINNVLVSAAERLVRESTNGYSYLFMQEMKQRFKDIEFHVVIGQDNVDSVANKWYMGEQFINEFNFIIVPRKDPSGNLIRSISKWGDSKPHVNLRIDPRKNASSKVRELIKKMDNVSSVVHDEIIDSLIMEHIPPSVWTYLHNNKLYKEKKHE